MAILGPKYGIVVVAVSLVKMTPAEFVQGVYIMKDSYHALASRT
jgi:hypothetical protein